jgi:hypothetical protein
LDYEQRLKNKSGVEKNNEINNIFKDLDKKIKKQHERIRETKPQSSKIIQKQIEKLKSLQDLRNQFEKLKTLNGQRKNVKKEIEKINNYKQRETKNYNKKIMEIREKTRARLVNKLSKLEKEIRQQNEKFEESKKYQLVLKTIKEGDEPKKLSQLNLNYLWNNLRTWGSNQSVQETIPLLKNTLELKGYNINNQNTKSLLNKFLKEKSNEEKKQLNKLLTQPSIQGLVNKPKENKKKPKEGFFTKLFPKKTSTRNTANQFSRRKFNL